MQKLLNFAILLVVFITFLNALAFFGLGIYYSIEAYIALVGGSQEIKPGLVIIESLDRFLIGFVFVIFSVGFSELFLPDFTFLKKYELPWLQVTNFMQLKTLLVSTILVALLVAWAPTALIASQETNLEWNILMFPACLLIMAVAAKFIKESH